MYEDMRKLQADEKEKQLATQQKLQQAQTPLGRPTPIALAPPGTAPTTQAVLPPPMPPMQAFGVARMAMLPGMRPPMMAGGVTPPPPPPTPPTLG